MGWAKYEEDNREILAERLRLKELEETLRQETPISTDCSSDCSNTLPPTKIATEAIKKQPASPVFAKIHNMWRMRKNIFLFRASTKTLQIQRVGASQEVQKV